MRLTILPIACVITFFTLSTNPLFGADTTSAINRTHLKLLIPYGLGGLSAGLTCHRKGEWNLFHSISVVSESSRCVAMHCGQLHS